jgi:hypothetical protein
MTRNRNAGRSHDETVVEQPELHAGAVGAAIDAGCGRCLERCMVTGEVECCVLLSSLVNPDVVVVAKDA